MASHAFATPVDWVSLSVPGRSNFVFDSDLVDGDLPIKLTWKTGPIEEDFTVLGATQGRRLSPLDGGRYIWNQPSGGSTWTVDANGGYYGADGAGSGGFVSISTGLSVGNLGRADFDASITATLGTRGVGLAPRFSDNNNHWRAFFDVAAGRVKVVRTDAGSGTTILTGSTVIAQGETHTLRVVTSGSDWSIYLDGVLEGSFTNSTASTFVTFCLNGYDTTTRVTRLRVERVGDCPATSYEILNPAKEIIASGSVAAGAEQIVVPDTAHVQGNGLGPRGLYRLYLRGVDRADSQFNDSYGVRSYLRMQDDPNGPVNPPKSTAAGLVADHEDIARAIGGLGPPRYSVLSDSLAVDATFRANVLAAATLTQAYYRDYESAARPRNSIVLFAQGTYGLAAGTVTTWVNELKHVVNVWEGFNEPNINGSYDSHVAEVQTYLDREVAPFYAEVKAEDPTAIVLAGSPVEGNGNAENWIRSFCTKAALMDPVPFDAMAVHAYNSWDTIDQARRYVALVRDCLDDAGLTDIPIWQTEQGTEQSGRGGLYAPWGGPLEFGGYDYVNLAFMQELGGLPMEQSVRWYDKPHGFNVLHYWFTAEGPSMTPCTMRTMTAELYDKPNSTMTVLDFNDHDAFYAGGVWVNAGGDKVIGVRAECPGAPSVRFAVTGATELTMVDPWGNTDVLTVNGGGYVYLPMTGLPSWLRVPAGATATLVAADWPTNLATAATAAASGWQTNLTRINDGFPWSSFFYSTGPGGTGTPYVDKTQTYPQTITLTFPDAVNADHAVIHNGPCRNDNGTWRAFTVETSTNGTDWVQVHSYDETGDDWVFSFTSDASNTTVESYWQHRNVHFVPFDRQSVKAIRFNVTAVSDGGFVDYDTSQIFYAAKLEARWNVVSDIRLFDAATPTTRAFLLLAA
jgi:hypothetical protein